MADDDLDGVFKDLFRSAFGPQHHARQESIAATVLPSTYIPAVGEFFRMRFATVGDRSYIDNVYECRACQAGAVVGKLVHGQQFGEKVRVFVVGDALFYEANELAAALLAESEAGGEAV